MSSCLAINPPSFLSFILHITDPEDIDLTMHCKYIWVMLENFAELKNMSLIKQLESNYVLIEKLLIGTKRTIGSKSEISQHMRNVINHIRSSNTEIDRMIKEATKKLSA